MGALSFLFLRSVFCFQVFIMAQVYRAVPEVIRRLLLQEHGVRKCARIMLFMNRRKALSILLGLPEETMLAILREMLKLQVQIKDLQGEFKQLQDELGLLSEVIELEAPKDQVGESFSLFQGLKHQEIFQLGKFLKPESLVQLFIHAPIQSAALLLSGLQNHALRQECIEALTRPIHRKNKTQEELRREILEAQGKLEPLKEHNQHELKISQFNKKKKQALKKRAIRNEQGRLEKEPMDAKALSQPLSLEALIYEREDKDLQRMLAQIPLEHLALVLGSFEAGQHDQQLEQRILDCLSQRRRLDLEKERKNLGEATNQERQAARWALAKRLTHLARELP